VPSPNFWLFYTDDNPMELAKQVNFPCVVKPLSLSASQGVIRTDNPEQFVTAFHRVIAIMNSPEVQERLGATVGQILVEDFISGPEVALEGLLMHGKLKVLALFDKPDPLEGPFFEETLYITPSRLPTSTQEAITACMAQTAEALSLREGPIHAELRINDQGPWVIEIAARSIGGLCSRTLRFGTGLSLEEVILRHAIGLEIESLDRQKLAAGVMMLPIPHAGILRAVHGQEEASRVEGIEEVVMTIPLDQEVQPLPEGSRYLGFIFARSESPEVVEAALREAYQRLNIIIEPLAV
ncbi:MAG: ATP-grasp domain-containing protein, partial [Nitrososphaera sp.]|nr:ATP-grasp domain-containing protein [Nitrososphaera sp.]